MTQGLRIERVEAAGADYDRVVELGDANSATLGQLPYAVFEEAAASGCLLAAKLRGEVIGYALFALRKRRHEVSLTHLCVRSDMRRTGAARRLVEEIVRPSSAPSGHPAALPGRLRRPSHVAAARIRGMGAPARTQPSRAHAGGVVEAHCRPVAVRLAGADPRDSGRRRSHPGGARHERRARCDRGTRRGCVDWAHGGLGGRPTPSS